MTKERWNGRTNRQEWQGQKQQEGEWIETRQLEGRKAVLEALNHNKHIDRLLLRREADESLAGTLKVIAAKAKEQGIVITTVPRVKLDSMAQSGNHQGVIALCPAKEYVEVQDILQAARQKGEVPFVLVLDEISDPHNLGAILRTAEAGGVHGVIIPKRRAVGLTGAVAKTSAGAIEHVSVARVTNIARTIEDLKAAGLWIICGDSRGGGKYLNERDSNEGGKYLSERGSNKSGADSGGGGRESSGNSLYKTDLSGPIALVIGAESSGVSRLVREKADFEVYIPMLGHVGSLNASVACGILIYEVVRKRLG